jgi:hypothetical protein
MDNAFLQATPYVRDLTLCNHGSLWYSTSRFTSAAKHNASATFTAASDTKAYAVAKKFRQNCVTKLLLRECCLSDQITRQQRRRELDGSFRRGRRRSSPSQFGQTWFIPSVHVAQ